jgi:hypothetical protein
VRMLGRCHLEKEDRWELECECGIGLKVGAEYKHVLSTYAMRSNVELR